MNKFWQFTTIIGLALLATQAALLLAILLRMPPAPVTFGQWRNPRLSPADRQQLQDRMPFVESFVDNFYVPVRIEDQPVQVRPVR